VAGGGRRLHNEVLHNLYSSPHIVTVVKSRRIWVGHVESAERWQMRTKF